MEQKAQPGKLIRVSVMRIPLSIISVLFKKEVKSVSWWERGRGGLEKEKKGVTLRKDPSRSAIQMRPPFPSPGGICSRDQLVTWESLCVTARTISVCDNHTEQGGFYRRHDGLPVNGSSTSAWLRDDPSRFSTLALWQVWSRSAMKSGYF